MTDTSSTGTPMNRKVFIACGIPGLAVMGFGIYGLIHGSGQTHPTEWIKWFVGGLVVHDFLIAPLVFVIAVVLVRRAAAPWKASLQGGLFATGILTLAAWPYVAGYGRRPDNKTLLPNNYAHGLFVVLAVVWLSAAITAVVARRRTAVH